MTYDEAIAGTYTWQNIHRGKSYNPYKLPLKICIPVPDDAQAREQFLLEYQRLDDWREIIGEFSQHTFHVACVFEEADGTKKFLSYHDFLRKNGIFVDYYHESD